MHIDKIYMYINMNVYFFFVLFWFFALFCFVWLFVCFSLVNRKYYEMHHVSTSPPFPSQESSQQRSLSIELPTSPHDSAATMKSWLDHQAFAHGEELDVLRAKTERIYADAFTQG